MRRQFSRALLASFAAVALLAAGAPARGEELLFALFGSYLEALRVQAGIPGLSVVVVGQNDILWERYFGKPDVDRSDPTSASTLFELDGVTQVFTSALALQCVEQGRLSLDERIGNFQRGTPDGEATIAQLLSHTYGTPGNLAFTYDLSRVDPLAAVIRKCTGNSYRENISTLLERLAMMDSVPGLDAATLKPPSEGMPDADTAARYADALQRLAVPYTVDARTNRATRAEYTATTLTASSGLISTARDLAQFDLALKQDLLLQPETLALAWRAPVDRLGMPLPHGLGWFVQTYKGQPVAWQFGMSAGASSSLIVTLPSLRITLIALANSDGLTKPFALASGDVTKTPFGRLFLELFVR